ncbi:antibiotic acetyltransferase [Kordia sp. TARA_039_SRF]|nr:antibiotic acetyltransferase [Kordia sp. TARA_039_SRF]
MISYFISLFSLKKLTHKAVSFLAYWDKTSSFTKTSEIRRFAKLKSSTVGRYSRINPNCKLANTNVGNFTAIGRDTTIGLGKHPMNYVSTQNIFYKKNNMNNRWVKPINMEPTPPISIGSDVWIGVEAMILDGLTVGDGAVIGARAVVTKNVPPYAIAVGAPAKIIKYRFEQEVIDRLLEIQWWNFTDEEIDKYVEFFREEEITLEVINKYFPK